MTHLTADVQAVQVGTKVDEFLKELENDESTKTLLPEISETINYKGSQLIIKSKVVPAGVSKKGEAYDAFTVLDVYKPGKVVNGKIKPIGRAFPVYDKDEDGNSTDTIVGYRLRMKGYVKGGSTAATKEVTTSVFGLTFKIESRYSEAKQKDYVALIDDEGSIAGFASDYYGLGMSYSYKTVVIKKGI